MFVAPIDNSCFESKKNMDLSQLAGLWHILGAAFIVAMITHLGIDACYKGDKRLSILMQKKGAYTKDERAIILETYPMAFDFIHIPSKDLHKQLEKGMRSKLSHNFGLISTRWHRKG